MKIFVLFKTYAASILINIDSIALTTVGRHCIVIMDNGTTVKQKCTI